jgi:hypothetical protein
LAGAAGTLNLFSSFAAPQLGHLGRWPLRINNSNSLLHCRQVYS